MISEVRLKTLLIVGLSLLFNLSQASDLEKEKRWANQVVDSILVGEAQWLNAGKVKFLSIYTENTSPKSLGGAIILHGTGVHPNWGQVIRPLRTQLPLKHPRPHSLQFTLMRMLGTNFLFDIILIQSFKCF